MLETKTAIEELKARKSELLKGLKHTTKMKLSEESMKEIRLKVAIELTEILLQLIEQGEIS